MFSEVCCFLFTWKVCYGYRRAFAFRFVESYFCLLDYDASTYDFKHLCVANVSLQFMTRFWSLKQVVWRRKLFQFINFRIFIVKWSSFSLTQLKVLEIKANRTIYHLIDWRFKIDDFYGSDNWNILFVCASHYTMTTEKKKALQHFIFPPSWVGIICRSRLMFTIRMCAYDISHFPMHAKPLKFDVSIHK